eukprot:1182250-Amphidinium_carterae.1
MTCEVPLLPTSNMFKEKGEQINYYKLPTFQIVVSKRQSQNSCKTTTHQGKFDENLASKAEERRSNPQNLQF